MQHSKFSQIGPVKLPLDWNGDVRDCILRYFDFSNHRYLMVEIGDIELFRKGSMLVRVQSACSMGHLFGSRACDCAWQFAESKRLLFAEGGGLLIYAYDQNSKGLTLKDDFLVYAEAQSKDMETLTEAFDLLSFSYENRFYDDIATIIGDFYGISRIKLLTNDPARVHFFSSKNFEVERVAIQAPMDEYNGGGLKVKKEAFGHLIQL